MRIRWPGMTPARRCRGRGHSRLGRPSPWTALPGCAARPARPSRRPRAPLLGPGAREDGTPDPGPRGPSQGDSAPSLLEGPPGRAAEGLGAPEPRSESYRGRRWASGPRGGRPSRRHPHLSARVCEADAGPLPGPPAGLTEAPAWAAGRGVGLLGAPRVRGGRGRELPPLASGPRAAAAATALSRRRPRRPPPRARPLAPQRPEPPPGPRRRRRPPLRFVFPSLCVPCLCLSPAPTPRYGH